MAVTPRDYAEAERRETIDLLIDEGCRRMHIPEGIDVGSPGHILLEMALDLTEEVLFSNSSSEAWIWREVSFYLLQKGDYPRALLHVERWAELEPSNYTAKIILHRLYDAFGYHRQAAHTLWNAAKLLSHPSKAKCVHYRDAFRHRLQAASEPETAASVIDYAKSAERKGLEVSMVEINPQLGEVPAMSISLQGEYPEEISLRIGYTVHFTNGTSHFLEETPSHLERVLLPLKSTGRHTSFDVYVKLQEEKIQAYGYRTELKPLKTGTQTI